MNLPYHFRYFRRTERDALVRRLALAVEMRALTYAQAFDAYEAETATWFKAVKAFCIVPGVFGRFLADTARLHTALSAAETRGALRALGETRNFSEE